jgi:hypothetical protein
MPLSPEMLEGFCVVSNGLCRVKLCLLSIMVQYRLLVVLEEEVKCVLLMDSSFCDNAQQSAILCTLVFLESFSYQYVTELLGKGLAKDRVVRLGSKIVSTHN